MNGEGSSTKKGAKFGGGTIFGENSMFIKFTEKSAFPFEAFIQTL
jgi:hypothetical protein